MIEPYSHADSMQQQFWVRKHSSIPANVGRLDGPYRYKITQLPKQRERDDPLRN